MAIRNKAFRYYRYNITCLYRLLSPLDTLSDRGAIGFGIALLLAALLFIYCESA